MDDVRQKHKVRLKKIFIMEEADIDTGEEHDIKFEDWMAKKDPVNVQYVYSPF